MTILGNQTYILEKIIALNDSLRNYTTKNKLVYLDFHTPMADRQNGLNTAYSNDGVHPNKLGYQMMAPLAEKAIAIALQQQ
jgi:lysophospholipase L1-like esterase